MFAKRPVCISFWMHNMYEQFVTLFSSLQWQEMPAQMQSIAPQRQVGELCYQVINYQLHPVLNLLWLPSWPDCLLYYSTGLNPAELNRNKQKSAAHLIGKIWSRRHSKEAGYIFFATKQYLIRILFFRSCRPKHIIWNSEVGSKTRRVLHRRCQVH